MTMKSDGWPDRATENKPVAPKAVIRHVGRAPRVSLKRQLALFSEHPILLPIGTVIALVWANLALDSYERFAHTMHFAVNDIGMVFFFALAAKEVVEATASGGALYSVRRAAMPLLAAVGGMLGPAAIYLALVAITGADDLTRGWAIPCATDIAFSYLVARLIFGPKHAVIPFLLLLAIVDDALGLLILAVFYPTGPIRVREFIAILAIALTIAWWLRRRRILNFWPYVAGAGLISWVAFYRGGLHPALALVPVIPFVPHAARDPGLFVEAPANQHDPLSEFGHWWKIPVQGILFLFGLVNAGVTITSAGLGTWIVLVAILLGKPIGIVLFTALGTAAGLHRPALVTWTDLIVVGLAAGIGFTVALFFATAAFPEGRLLEETKMGALLSVSAALLAAAGARVLRVGRHAGEF